MVKKGTILNKKREQDFDKEENSGTILTGFTIVCDKCGSKNVDIDIENGGCYSEYTEFPGELGLKCKKCGNAYAKDI